MLKISLKKRVVPLILSGFLIAFICNRLFFFSFSILESASSCLLYPILFAQHKIIQPMKDFLYDRQSLQEVSKELTELKTEHEQLMAENIKLQASLYFAEQTNELRSFEKKYDVKNEKLVQIIARTISGESQTVLVNAGSHHGICKDMVGVYKNWLLGRVTKVYPFYSKLLLVTDKSCKVGAYCAQSKTNGIYEGSNCTTSSSLNHVSHLSSIEVDDLVLSSGEGLIFPQGFGLGRIKRARKEGLLYLIQLEPLFNIADIDYCYLIQKSNQ